MAYFTVRIPVRIAGKTYRPCICYDLPKMLELTVLKMKNEGKADVYDEPVYFISGAPVEKKEKEIKVKKAKKASRKAESIPETLPEKEIEMPGEEASPAITEDSF